MTYEEYWHKTPYLAVSYRKAHDLSLEKKNAEAWWQGFYFYEAITSALSFKGKVQYPKKPHELKTNPEEDAKKERKRIKDSLTSFKAQWDKKYGRRENNSWRTNTDQGS